jgi:hypothetical protein
MRLLIHSSMTENAASPPPGANPHPPLAAVDDGTGCLECIAWLNSSGDGGGASVTAGGGGVSASDFGINLGGLRLGALVRMQGRITEYKSPRSTEAKKQMVVNTLQACGDANAEVLFWLDWVRCAEEIEEEAGRRKKSSASPLNSAAGAAGA